MKRLKNQKGAITIITLVSILFMVSFLISSYILVANKSKVQQEMVEETRKIYESKVSMEEIYNSYLNKEELIPIYTVEQLLSIGNEELIAIPQNNGEIYKFSKDANYILMNDLEFITSEWIDLIGRDEEGNPKEWTAIGEVVKDDIDGFTGNFEGNNYKIKVTDLNGILHECNIQNEYYYYRNIDLVIKSIDTFASTGEFEVTIKRNTRRKHNDIWKRFTNNRRRPDIYTSKKN